MAESTQELAYQEALRGLTQQQGVLNEVRSRANVLLSAASIVTAVLGAQTLSAPDAAGHSPGLEGWGWVAVCAFVGLSVLVLAILWPLSRWKFRFSGTALLNDYAEPTDRQPASLLVMYREMTIYSERNYDANERRLSLLFVFFRIATALLAVEVVAWIIELTKG